MKRPLIESALIYIKMIEDLEFDQMKISLKSFDIPQTIKAYKLLAEKVNYPFHIGITEAGIGSSGIVRSSIGIGILLWEGIGNTIRVSLTAPSVDEVIVGKEILKSLNKKVDELTIISCPTCGRCSVDLRKIVEEFKKKTVDIKKRLKIAIMGCVVNGPGEAKEADIGIACGKGKGVLFVKGKVIKKVNENEIVDTLINEIIVLTKNI